MYSIDKLTRLGAARRSTLAGTAAGRRAVAAGVASGRLRDIGGGWVAATDAEPAVVAARRLGGVITCVSAAEMYGLRVLTPPGRPHVAIPRARSTRRAQEPVRVHPEGRWIAPDADGLPLAPLVDAVGRVLRCLPLRDAVVIVDSALHKRLVTVDAVAATLTGPGSRNALATLARGDGRSRSVIETLARLALEDAGLPVAAGVEIDGVGEVDLLVDHVVVECDGFAYHSGREAYRTDRRRDRALVAKGYLVLRFTWEEIIKDPQQVTRAVLQALGRT